MTQIWLEIRALLVTTRYNENLTEARALTIMKIDYFLYHWAGNNKFSFFVCLLHLANTQSEILSISKTIAELPSKTNSFVPNNFGTRLNHFPESISTLPVFKVAIPSQKLTFSNLSHKPQQRQLITASFDLGLACGYKKRNFCATRLSSTIGISANQNYSGLWP